MTKEMIARLKKQISIGNIAVILFLAGGFYYTTEYEFTTLEESIEETDRTFEQHIEYRFRPLRETVRENKQSIQRVQGNYETLHELLQQQQENNQKQFERIESRLDYIINRIDNR